MQLHFTYFYNMLFQQENAPHILQAYCTDLLKKDNLNPCMCFNTSVKPEGVQILQLAWCRQKQLKQGADTWMYVQTWLCLCEPFNSQSEACYLPAATGRAATAKFG